MAKAYLNALMEEGTKEEIFNMLVKVDAENDELRRQLAIIMRKYENCSYEDYKARKKREIYNEQSSN